MILIFLTAYSQSMSGMIKHHTKKTNNAQTIKEESADRLVPLFYISVERRVKYLRPKCGRRILDIEVGPPGRSVLVFPAIHFKTVKESDTYILEGVLRFTINVDCSTPFLPLKGENTDHFIRKCRLQSRRDETTQEDRDDMDTR